MSKFTGPQGSGAMRRHREKKRAEAEERSIQTRHDRTRSHRLGRCSCSKPGTREHRLLESLFGRPS